MKELKSRVKSKLFLFLIIDTLLQINFILGIVLWFDSSGPNYGIPLILAGIIYTGLISPFIQSQTNQNKLKYLFRLVFYFHLILLILGLLLLLISTTTQSDLFFSLILIFVFIPVLFFLLCAIAILAFSIHLIASLVNVFLFSKKIDRYVKNQTDLIIQSILSVLALMTLNLDSPIPFGTLVMFLFLYQVIMSPIIFFLSHLSKPERTIRKLFFLLSIISTVLIFWSIPLIIFYSIGYIIISAVFTIKNRRVISST